MDCVYTFVFMCPKFTPSSSIRPGSPSYPSVENAASQPVLRPPCSPMRPDTPWVLKAAFPAPYDGYAAAVAPPL